MPPTLAGSPVRALLFDLDGLLVDSEPVWFEVEGAFLARHGHTWTREAAQACMGQGTPSTLRFWRERYGIDVDLERDTEAIVDALLARAADIPAKPGAPELLAWASAQHLVLAVASSSRRRLIEAVLDARGLRRFFAAVISGQEVARGKPAPDIFLCAAALLGVPPADCVVLEDAPAGVEAATAAGMRVIAVPSVASPRLRELATAVAASLNEVPALLGGP